MTYEEAMDRCSIIRDTLISGHSITFEPTLKKHRMGDDVCRGSGKVDTKEAVSYESRN